MKRWRASRDHVSSRLGFGLLLATCLGTFVALVPIPARATTATWRELPRPAATDIRSLCDSLHHRGLLIVQPYSSDGTRAPSIWAVSSDPVPVWTKIWEGSRPRDRAERYRLYQRQIPGTPASPHPEPAPKAPDVQ